MKATCNSSVAVYDCLTESEARETAANLAKLKVRIGGFDVTDVVPNGCMDYKTEEGNIRWQASVSANGVRG